MIWHGAQLDEVLNFLDTDPEKGLSNSAALQRVERYGKNTLSLGKEKNFILGFLAQFNNFPTIALIAVAITALILSLFGYGVTWYIPFLALLFVVLFNAICTYQKNRAENLVDILRDVSAPTVTVIREGITKKIDSAELVPGDIIMLKEGDYIAADARIISAMAMSCDESPLTESHVPVDKNAGYIAEDITPIAERENMIFAGCSVTHGVCTAVVTAIGAETEYGKEQSMREQIKVTKFPIRENILTLSRILTTVSLVVALLVFVLGLIFDNSESITTTLLDSFTSALSVATFVLPTSFPLAVSIVLTLGLQRLVSKNVIVKDLPSIETMGGISVICADTTGTLTENIMTVKKVFNGQSVSDFNKDCGEDIRLILELATICNDASDTSGDPTGIGIIDGCRELTGMSKEDIENLYPRLAEVPFDSERMLMTTVNMINGKPFAIVKGAPETLLPLCTGNCVDKFGPVIDNLAAEALRVIAVAAKPVDEIPTNPSSEELECQLNFIGLIGLEDNPRADVVKAVEECKKASIRTVMMTGDHPATARAIARRLGILTDDTEMLTSVELSEMSDEELCENIEKYSVYARITNAERSRIVEAWKSKGHCVAVTGDSVDDVPSLMAANVGYSMGKSGTDVSKGVSDIILLDDDFSSIVYSIKEGRAIFANVRKTVNFILGSNSAVFFFMLLASLIFGALPITALLLLLLNLVINIFPVISLGMEPPESKIMNTAPQKRQAVFTKELFINAGIQMLTSAIFSIIAFAVGNIHGTATAMTMAFTVLALSQVFFTLTARTENTPVFLCILKNRIPLYVSLISVLVLFLIVATPVHGIFGLAALTAGNWILVILFAALPCLIAEIYKTVRYFKAK